MKTKSFSPMGPLHPALFLAGVYIVALFFSIFCCSVIFYSCNSSSVEASVKDTKSQPLPVPRSNNAVTVLH